ncbi:inositol polyphosphate-4-phosphatase [Schistosoma bovis]|uniref:Inositol polyphosphate-4-phosphatase n=2 Tax=Schistosoma TaxID=6181 RepID=A0A430Q7J8_SCHBO|nr:inositol polyphosphate-4-phosphatase [Schistosoma bovis]
MGVNSKELGCVSPSWNSSFEGILYWKQKVDSRLKRGCIFSEHWCRLKGNILILCRSPDRTSNEVSGVVLLERFTVSRTRDEEISYSFRLDFDSGDKPLVFVARSEDEAEKWCHHLNKAQLAPRLRRFTLLRDEIRRITGSDPLEAGFSSNSVTPPTIVEEGSLNDEGLEVMLKCLNIGDMAHPNELPNTCLFVSVSTSVKSNWTPVGATEIIESALIGETITTIKVLLDSSSLLFPLRDDCSPIPVKYEGLETTFPSIVVQSRKQKPLDPTAAKVDANMLSLRSVCDNLLSKRYKFQDSMGETMHIIEFMGESKLCYAFPIEYLKTLIQSEYLIYDSLSRTGSSKPIIESLRKERMISMKQTLEQYEANLRNLVDYTVISIQALQHIRIDLLFINYVFKKNCLICKKNFTDAVGPLFKSSNERANPRYDFVPTNLHVNQIALTDVDGQVVYNVSHEKNNIKTVSSHNIISVGAFSLASRRYKSGGLFRMAFDAMITPTRTYPPSELSYLNLSSESPVASATCLLNTKPIGKAMDLLYRGTHSIALLRSDLAGLIQRLNAPGQAEPLAQRLEKTVSSIQWIFSDKLLSNLNVLPVVSCDFEVIITLLTQLSSVEIMKSTNSQPSQPNDHVIIINKKKNESRENLIDSLDKAGQKFSITLERMWESAASVLWDNVLSGLSDLSNQQTLSVSKESSGNYSDLIAEAERSAYPNMLPINDNVLTAVSIIQDSFNYRHHACVCQLLTAVLTALSVHIPRWDRKDWEQAAVCGVLAQFEGLLSCYGDEQGMIEDWAWAIDYLLTYRVTLRPSGNFSDSVIDTSGRNSENTDSNVPTSNLSDTEEFHVDFKVTRLNECELTVPWKSWVHAPSEIQARGRVRIRLHPVSFVVGINELQSVAETLDKTAVQNAVNNHGLTSLRAYFNRYTKHFGAPGRTVSNQDVWDLLTDITHHLSTPVRSKPVEVLQLASEITQAFHGLRITTCKSAKDRTAMSVTLEQIQWLKSEGMHESCFTKALQCIRSTGLRLDNVMKNTGKRKYAFNRLQLLSFPRLYKPPMGTYSTNVSS